MTPEPEPDPIAAQLGALVADRERQRALSSPQVKAGPGGRYFVADCPNCQGESYQHLEPATAAPGAAARLEPAYCEDCGVVEHWRVLGGLPDGSVRVLGPDFGADPPPEPG